VNKCRRTKGSTPQKYRIGEQIDALIPIVTDDRTKTTYGQRRVSAMILNDLGFTNSTLYMAPKFFKNKPVDVLLGEGAYDAHDGNSSDKTSFHESIELMHSFYQQLECAEDFLWVADSAL
jgi:transposase